MFGMALASLAVAGERQGKALEVPGLLSVDSPGKEYRWKHIANKELKGTKASYFLCTNADSSARMVLIVEHRSADTEAKRSATVKAHWNSLAALQEQGFKDLNGKRPSIAAPIPDKVYFSMSGKGPDGNPVFIRCAVVFGKSTYAFQALAGTTAECDRLIAVVKTLNESK
jgi:hypothetical protein